MESIIIACDNLKDEIEYILNKNNKNKEVIYIKSKLHNTPKLLKQEIQKEIDKQKTVNNIILLFGVCGNGTIGLKSENANIIMPRVDDCISLYLGGIENRKKIENYNKTYFITKRYVENELSVYNEMKTLINKYGEKKAKKMYKMLFDKYEYIRSIDTNAYDENEIIDKVNEMCIMFNLKYEKIKSDLSIIEDLLNENTNINIITTLKGEEIEFEKLGF